jgi:hypothetical protein
VVFVDQSAELVATLDLSMAQLRLRIYRVWWQQREPAVRALLV